MADDQVGACVESDPSIEFNAAFTGSVVSGPNKALNDKRRAIVREVIEKDSYTGNWHWVLKMLYKTDPIWKSFFIYPASADCEGINPYVDGDYGSNGENDIITFVHGVFQNLSYTTNLAISDKFEFYATHSQGNEECSVNQAVRGAGHKVTVKTNHDMAFLVRYGSIDSGGAMHQEGEFALANLHNDDLNQSAANPMPGGASAWDQMIAPDTDSLTKLNINMETIETRTSPQLQAAKISGDANVINGILDAAAMAALVTAGILDANNQLRCRKFFTITCDFYNNNSGVKAEDCECDCRPDDEGEE